MGSLEPVYERSGARRRPRRGCAAGPGTARSLAGVSDRELLPWVTPYLLRRADEMCARRLANEYEGGAQSHDPVHRSRMRDAFLAAVRDVHVEPTVPALAMFDGIGADLEPEERRVLEQATRWYVEIFGDRAARLHDHGLDEPTASRGGVRIGGWVDLTVVAADDTLELRQFELWGGRAPVEDPLELEAVMYDVYADFMVNVLAIPVLTGRKTANERFPGAINTLACEAMMRDGKALQMGTSHELGQNFAKVFGTQFSSETGEPGVRLADVVGREHPHDGRADHGPRRRQRPAPAPTAGTDAGGGGARAGRGRRRRGGRAARLRAAGRGRPGPARRRHRRRASGGG